MKPQEGSSWRSLLIVAALLAALVQLNFVWLWIPGTAFRYFPWLVMLEAASGPLVAAWLLKKGATPEDGRLPWAILVSAIALSAGAAISFFL
jgi:hypothetical protein